VIPAGQLVNSPEARRLAGTAAAGKQAGAGSNLLPRRFCRERETSITERPGNREIERENLRPAGDGHAPRPANEPAGSKGSVQTEKTVTDPGSGEEN